MSASFELANSRRAVEDLLIITDRDHARLTVLQPHERLRSELDRVIVVSSGHAELLTKLRIRKESLVEFTGS